MTRVVSTGAWAGVVTAAAQDPGVRGPRCVPGGSSREILNNRHSFLINVLPLDRYDFLRNEYTPNYF